MNESSHRIIPHRATLLGTGVACWAGFVLVAWWHTSGASAGFDRAGLLLWREGASLQPIGPDWLSDAFRLITLLGGGPFRTVLGLVILGILLVCRYLREGLVLVAIMVPSAEINSLLKSFFAQPRPDIVPYLAGFGGFSFPSGHSMNGAATYLGLALIFAGMLSRYRSALLAGALCLSLVIAFSRVWLGVHYPTDAIAGWLAGTGWALMVASLLRPKTGRD